MLTPLSPLWRRLLRHFERRIDVYPETPPEIPPARLHAFLWYCTQGARPYIFAVAICTACIGLLDASLLGIAGVIVDRLAQANRIDDLLGRQAWLLVGALVVSPLIVVAGNLLREQCLTGNLTMRLRWQFHRLMLAQSLGFFQDEFAGRVASKVLQTAKAVRDVVLLLADVMIFFAASILTVLAMVGGFDLWLLGPFAGWIVIYAIVLRYFVPRLAKVAAEQAEASTLLTGRITDAYTHIATVKLFSHGHREADYSRVAMQAYLRTAYANGELVAIADAVVYALNIGLVLLVAALAVWRWSGGLLAIGGAGAAISMAVRLNGMSHWAMWSMAALFEHWGVLQAGAAILARPRLVQDRRDAKTLRVGRGEITFERVRFSYGGERLVFDDLNLRIRPGEKVGLVGRSGAGKSSLVNLLLRFYNLDRGRILVDGQDIAAVTQDSLRRQIGVVSQDPALLHRSVRDNIVYGADHVTEGEIVAAAKAAAAHEFILGLRDAVGRTGYDALVGERGIKLSGGQRQRVAIARAMLKNAPILLLDEATSALDSELEVQIQASLKRLMAGKTVIAIAHRLSTIAAMDRLIVIDGGRIVEQGTHDMLLAERGIYAQLWRHQSGGMLAYEAVDESEVGELGQSNFVDS